jgi:hypothetical protein
MRQALEFKRAFTLNRRRAGNTDHSKSCAGIRFSPRKDHAANFLDFIPSILIQLSEEIAPAEKSDQFINILGAMTFRQVSLKITAF